MTPEFKRSVMESYCVEAEACLVCGVAWTPDVMEARDPRVAKKDPVKLVCAECWGDYTKGTP